MQYENANEISYEITPTYLKTLFYREQWIKMSMGVRLNLSALMQLRPKWTHCGETDQIGKSNI